MRQRNVVVKIRSGPVIEEILQRSLFDQCSVIFIKDRIAGVDELYDVVLTDSRRNIRRIGIARYSGAIIDRGKAEANIRRQQILGLEAVVVISVFPGTSN